jgi:hypothetical protein
MSFTLSKILCSLQLHGNCESSYANYYHVLYNLFDYKFRHSNRFDKQSDLCILRLNCTEEYILDYNWISAAYTQIVYPLS